MAHQAHALPWSCFANYEYTIRPHISSLPQLYMIESPNRLKELQHFANVFARRIREFGVSERAKYASSESFQQRAETWKKSDMDPEIEVPGVALEKEEALESGEKWRTGKKSRGPHVERKKVYSDAFKAKYKTVYEDWEPYKIESKQDIASWISLSDSYDENSCIDTLKILLMEAAAATHPVSERVEAGAAQKHAMESLLLLANKKETSASIRNWKHRGMYSEHYGIETVAEKALDAYLMFNLFFAMRENGSGICELDVAQDLLKESSGWYRSFMVPKEVETLRPKYMNTRLWADGREILPKTNLMFQAGYLLYVLTS